MSANQAKQIVVLKRACGIVVLMMTFEYVVSKRAIMRLTWTSKIKSSLYSRYYTEECDEWRSPSPWLGA